MRIIAGIALTLVFLNASIAPDRITFSVGTATAARGQKITVTIEVPAGVSIPIAVVHGAKSDRILRLSPGSNVPQLKETLPEKRETKERRKSMAGSQISYWRAWSD